MSPFVVLEAVAVHRWLVLEPSLVVGLELVAVVRSVSELSLCWSWICCCRFFGKCQLAGLGAVVDRSWSRWTFLKLSLLVGVGAVAVSFGAVAVGRSCSCCPLFCTWCLLVLERLSVGLGAVIVGRSRSCYPSVLEMLSVGLRALVGPAVAAGSCSRCCGRSWICCVMEPSVMEPSVMELSVMEPLVMEPSVSHQ